MKKEEKSFAEKMAILKRKGKALALSGITILCIGISLVLSAIPFAAKQNKAVEGLKNEAEIIIAQDEYENHCKTVQKQLKDQYLKGELTSSEYANKIRELTSQEYVVRHFPNEKIQQLKDEKKSAERAGVGIVAAGAGAGFAGIALCAGGFYTKDKAIWCPDDKELENE